MIAIKQTITRRGLNIDAQTWRGMIAQAWEDTAQFWYVKILPKHFTEAGKKEYGYAPRQKATPRRTKDGKYRGTRDGYETRKFRKYGHRKPLVLTGEMQRSIMRIMDIKGTLKSGKIALHGPKYLYMYRKDIREINKAKELSTISEKDANLCAKQLDASLMQQVKAHKHAIRIGQGHRQSA